MEERVWNNDYKNKINDNDDSNNSNEDDDDVTHDK